MKIAILILLFTIALNTQTNWYVDIENTSGNYDGQGWATAWTNMDSIRTGNTGVNWSIMEAGDTIYVSGGTDSTTYPGGQVVRGTTPYPCFDPPVVICPSWESNYNGDVWFVNTDSTQRCFNVSFISGIKVTGFNFKRGNNLTSDFLSNPEGRLLFIMEEDSFVTIENCNLYSSLGQGGAIAMYGAKHTINNCLIDIAENTNPHEQDPIGGGGTTDPNTGGYTITNNRVFYRPHSTDTSAHRDLIHINYFGSDAQLTTTIANNIMIMDAPYSADVNSGIYTTTRALPNRFLIYNNIIISNARSGGSLINIQGLGDGQTTVEAYNNTLIGHDGQTVAFAQPGEDERDSLIFKNNINVLDTFMVTQMIKISNTTTQYDSCVYDIDYNFWSKTGGYVYPGNFGYTGDYYDWGEWAIEGHDVNSDSGSVTFTNIYDTLAASYYTEQGRNAGVDLSGVSIPTTSYTGTAIPPLTEDILGNARGTNWDMGALEYQTGKTIWFINNE